MTPAEAAERAAHASLLKAAGPLIRINNPRHPHVRLGPWRRYLRAYYKWIAAVRQVDQERAAAAAVRATESELRTATVPEDSAAGRVNVPTLLSSRNDEREVGAA